MRYCLYFRTSTARQNYGIDAQKETVERYLASLKEPYEITGTFEERESGRNVQRIELAKALSLCKATGSTLLVSKLDRLSRSALQILTLLSDSKVKFTICDCPSADFMTIGVMALLGQREAELISIRTREGLAAARRRGVKLGSRNPGAAWAKAVESIKAKRVAFASEAIKSIEEIIETGIPRDAYSRIATILTKRGEKSPRGKAWSGMAVKRILMAQQ